MTLENIKVNNQQIISIDNEPLYRSENLVNSNGVQSFFSNYSNTFDNKTFYNVGEFVEAINVQNKKWIYLDGSIVDMDEPLWYVFTFEVSPGDVYETLVQGYAQVAFYALYDENDNPTYVDWYGGGSNTIKKVIIYIPENVKYLRLGRAGGQSHAIGTTVKKVLYQRIRKESLTNNVVNSINTFDTIGRSVYIKQNVNWTEHYFYSMYIDQNLFDLELSPYDRADCVRLNVQPYEKYRITGYSGQQISLYGVLTSQGIQWLYPEPVSTRYDDIELEIPADGIALYVNSYNANGPTTIYKREYYSIDSKWKDKKWCCIGDSITEQYKGEWASQKQYFQFIVEQTGIHFVNCATSGRGYKNAETEEHGYDAFYQKASVERYPDLADADVITVYGSVNDMFKGYPLGDVTDTTTDTLCGCVNKTLDNLYICNPTAVIGIITPCPVYGFKPEDDTCEMARYCNKIVEICRRRSIPCLDLYHQSGFHPWDQNFKSAAFMNSDGTHPNEIGHKIMYPHFLNFLETLI